MGRKVYGKGPAEGGGNWVIHGLAMKSLSGESWKGVLLCMLSVHSVRQGFSLLLFLFN